MQTLQQDDKDVKITRRSQRCRHYKKMIKLQKLQEDDKRCNHYKKMIKMQTLQEDDKDVNITRR